MNQAYRPLPIRNGVWIVWYQARPIGSAAAYQATRVTIVAEGTDDAFAQGARDLGEDFDLGFPISAEPVLLPS